MIEAADGSASRYHTSVAAIDVRSRWGPATAHRTDGSGVVVRPHLADAVGHPPGDRPRQQIERRPWGRPLFAVLVTGDGRRVRPDISPPPGGGQTDARPIELVFVGDADGDDEDGVDSRPDDADGGWQFFRNTRRTEENGGIYGGPDTLCETGVDADSRALIEIGDLKPGDFGFAPFRLELCDNPGFLWLNGGLDSASENGRTEPERDDPDEETGTVERLDEVQVAYAVGTTNDIAAGPDATPLPLPENGTLQNQTTLRAFLNGLASERGIGSLATCRPRTAAGRGETAFPARRVTTPPSSGGCRSITTTKSSPTPHSSTSDSTPSSAGTTKPAR